MIIKQFKISIGMFLFLALLAGLIYPFVITGIAQVVFPQQAKGSLITRNNKIIGSELIGQQFDQPQYFWSRLSATGQYPYNAALSGGSNLSVMNPDLLKNVQGRIYALRSADTNNHLPIPVDLVTASGSGLDPNISMAAAGYQVNRVAQARAIPVERVLSLIDQYTEGRQFGFLGEPRVNVLLLNLALDELK
jgi:K+-transporting ATPase ATPase C chain